MRVLVVGGTGFIGEPVMRRLVERDHELLVFHRGRTEYGHAGPEHVHGDRKDLRVAGAA